MPIHVDSAPLAAADAIAAAIQEDLRNTGFVAPQAPPALEPLITRPISTMSAGECRVMYDECLAFSEYLTGVLVQLASFYRPAKHKLEVSRAKLKLEHTKLANDLRDARVIVDTSDQAAELMYIATMMDAHEERRKKLSKIMERLWRQIYDQNTGGPAHPTFGAGRAQGGRLPAPSAARPPFHVAVRKG